MANIILVLRILCFTSVFQILLISFYLFIKKKGSYINKLLISMLLIVWVIFITGSFILLTPKLSLLSYDSAHLMTLSVFLVAPVLYIHFCALFRPDYKISYKQLVHAIPFFLIFIFLFNEIVIQRKLAYVFYPTAIYLISLLFLQNIIYFYLVLKDLARIPEANGNKKKLKLYKVLLLSTLVLFTLKLIIFIVWNILKYTDICVYITDIFFAAVFVIINVVVLFSINNPDILLGTFKYQNSPFLKEELTEYLKRINDFLTAGKLFTDPLISLERLSKNVKIQEKLLSQVINQESGLNFNDFINKYRINFAREMMEKCPDKKILEIAYECGFNSKTTFNTAFKKFTGLTPTEFRNNSEGIGEGYTV